MALTKENKKALAQWLDDIIKLKGVLEILDGILSKILVDVLDDKIFSKIPEEYHDEMNGFVDAIELNDYEAASVFIADILSGAIKTPLVDGTEAEVELYRGILSAIARYLEEKIKK